MFCYFKHTWVGVMVLAWDLGVCSSQGLKFNSLWCQLE
jgi:hypothetical protein